MLTGTEAPHPARPMAGIVFFDVEPSEPDALFREFVNEFKGDLLDAEVGTGRPNFAAVVTMNALPDVLAAALRCTASTSQGGRPVLEKSADFQVFLLDFLHGDPGALWDRLPDRKPARVFVEIALPPRQTDPEKLAKLKQAAVEDLKAIIGADLEYVADVVHRQRIIARFHRETHDDLKSVLSKLRTNPHFDTINEFVSFGTPTIEKDDAAKRLEIATGRVESILFFQAAARLSNELLEYVEETFEPLEANLLFGTSDVTVHELSTPAELSDHILGLMTAPSDPLSDIVTPPLADKIRAYAVDRLAGDAPPRQDPPRPIEAFVEIDVEPGTSRHVAREILSAVGRNLSDLWKVRNRERLIARIWAPNKPRTDDIIIQVIQRTAHVTSTRTSIVMVDRSAQGDGETLTEQITGVVEQSLDPMGVPRKQIETAVVAAHPNSILNALASLVEKGVLSRRPARGRSTPETRYFLRKRREP